VAGGAARHRERIDVLERKIAVQRVVAIAEANRACGRAAGCAGASGPPPAPDRMKITCGQMDRAAREAAADRQLEFLKKNVRGDS
jgi:hypothetical protein